MSLLCSVPTCQRHAEVYPVIWVYAPEKYSNMAPLRIVTDLQVCKKCGHRVQLDHVLNDEGWEVLEQVFVQENSFGIKPDRTRTQLTTMKITDYEKEMKTDARPH